MHWLVEWYEKQLPEIGVDVRLNTEATVSNVKAVNPDAVIIATGAKPIISRGIAGTDAENVFGIFDVLDGKSGLENKNVIIAGAGITGLECASYLNAKGCKTTIIDQLTAVAPNDNHNIVADDCSRLKAAGTEFAMGLSLKEIRADSITVADAEGAEKVLPCDAVVLSLGLVSERSIVDAFKANFEKVVEVGGCVDAGGKIPGATNGGFEAIYHLFEVKQPGSFNMTKEEAAKFGPLSRMDGQHGVYMAYLTDPEAIRRVLPAPLTPFKMPVVTVSVNHVTKPNFADDYYESILGVYCMYGDKLGLYPLSLVLSGPGSEMAMHAGRDNGSMPKKNNAEHIIKRNGDDISIKVSRLGHTLIEANLKVGAYNSPCAICCISPRLRANPPMAAASTSTSTVCRMRKARLAL